MKMVRVDRDREFILTKLRLFCKKQSIVIKYITPYIYTKNNLAKCRWYIIVTIKNSMLIDSRLPNTFWAEIIKTANYLQNRLPTKTITYEEIIFEKIWTKKKQNF